MAKKTIVKETVAAVRTVAGAALDAAAERARRVLTETVANTAARVEERAKDALPVAENAVKERLVKPIDRALGTRSAPRRKTARTAAKKRAAARGAKKKARKARPAAKKSTRRSAGRRKAAARSRRR